MKNKAVSLLAISARFWLLFIALVLPIFTTAQNDWRLGMQENGIQIYSTRIEGSQVKAFRAEMEVDTSLDSLIALFVDVPACRKWLYQCENPKLLETISFQERFVYHVSNMPWPALNRDYILHVTLHTLADKTGAEIRMRSAPHRTPETNHVRVEIIEGFYRIEVMPNGKIKLIWEQHIDPGGYLPAFIVNALLQDIPFNSLSRLRDLVLESQYQEAQLQFDNDGKIVGITN